MNIYIRYSSEEAIRQKDEDDGSARSVRSSSASLHWGVSMIVTILGSKTCKRFPRK